MFSWGMPSASTVYIGMRLTNELESTSINGHPINLCFNIARTVLEGVLRQHVIIGNKCKIPASRESILELLKPCNTVRNFGYQPGPRKGFHSIRLNGFGEAYLMNLISKQTPVELMILLKPFSSIGSADKAGLKEENGDSYHQ